MTARFSPKSRRSLTSAALILSSTCTYAIAEEKPNKLWSGDIELGYVSTSGNTEKTTAKSRVDIDREKDQWRYNIIVEALNSKSNDERTAEKYFASNKLAYQYTETDYIFGEISYDDDRFSGFDYQATASAGWGRRLINNEKMQWDVSAGPGYRFSKVANNTTGEDSEEVILQGFTKFVWDFSDTATFSQTVNVGAGEDNTISKSITTLKVQVIGALAVKLSYTIKYTENVPVNTKHADTETAITVVYSF